MTYGNHPLSPPSLRLARKRNGYPLRSTGIFQETLKPWPPS